MRGFRGWIFATATVVFVVLGVLRFLFGSGVLR